MNLRQFISTHSFATLVTHTGEIHVSHLNFLMDEKDDTFLYGHLALSNPQIADFSKSPKAIAVFSRDAVGSEHQFACYVQGEISIIDDVERKKRILNKLIHHYENSKWVINWEDSRYVEQLRAIVFFAIKITRVTTQKTQDLQYIAHQDNCMNLNNAEPESPQNIVYIPKHFYEGNQERLLACVRTQPIALVIMFNQDDVSLKYINVAHQQGLKVLKSSIDGDANTLMLFKGPHCYVSPRFYVSNFNVPTWNYSMVYVQGLIRTHGDEEDVGCSVEFEPYAIFGKFKLSQNRSQEDRVGVQDHLSCSTEYSENRVADCMYQYGNT